MKKSVFFISVSHLKVLALFFCYCCSQGHLTAATWYVKPTGSDVSTGNSWAAAYQTLTKALQSAASGDQIWVAAGTYKPTTGSDRTVSFNMKNGVTILGGFPAIGNPGEVDRNWTTNITTLSGNIGNPNFNNDNSLHVIYNVGLANTAILDGFVVTGGKADGGNQPHSWGGGILNDGASPTIRNCTFQGNSAYNGGGACNFLNSSSNFDRCNFENCTSIQGGGAMYNFASSTNIKNCSFSGNTAGIQGGAIYIHSNAITTINNSILFNNTASSNGGAIACTFSVLDMINCSLSGNSGTESILSLGSLSTITNCIVWGNPNSMTLVGGGTTSISYSIIQGGYSGSGNLNINPLFENPSSNLRLQSCSPAINKGNDTAVPYGVTTDLDNNNRFVGTVDMGAYEYQLNTAPAMAICKNITVQLNSSGNVSIPPAAVNNGSTGCNLTMYLSQTNFNCSNIGTNTLTFVVTDNNFNSSSCSAVVTIQDNTNPVATCKNATVYLDSTGHISVPAATVDNGSSDACGIASISLSPATFNCSNTGNNVVTLTVTDNHSQSATCSATVTVQDNIAPTAVCKNVTANLDAAGQAVVTAAAINNGSTDNCDIASLSLNTATFNCTNIGTNTITLTSADNAGNSATCSATVSVQDITKPIAICKSAIFYLDATGNVTVPATAVDNGSTDACGIAAFTLSKSNFNCSNIGNVPVSLEVKDNNGNKAYCTTTITIIDGTSPNVVCKPVTIDLNAAGQATTSAAAVNNGSTDNCSISNWNLSQTSFTCANLGANTVTLTATDQNGNASSCTATVTVRDLIAPTVDCQSVTIDLNAAGQATTTTAAVNNGSTDNCSISNWNLSQTEFTCANLGENIVTLTATDQYGNSSSCTATVTVRDLIAPIVVCQPVTIDLNAAGQATTTAAAVNNGSTNNCSINNWNLSQTEFTCANLGANTVTLTATDQNGNTASCTATVTVRDLIAPNVICQSVTIDLNAAGQAIITAAAVNNGSTDNCSISNWNLSQTEFTCANLGANTVTLTATDQNGNTASCTATVTVRDLIAPNVICQSVTIDLNAAGQATTSAAAVNNGSTDNCSISNWSLSQSSFTCANLGENTVTLTATDQYGNSSSCTATVTVRDLIAPIVVCQPVTIDLNAAGQATTTAAAVNNGSTNNCSINNWNLSQTEFTCANLGENIVTLTATDQNGNTSSCTATVTVRDLIAPNVVCKPATIDLNAAGQATTTAAAVNNGSTDNCSISNWNLSQTEFTCANLGANTVTLTATDQNGNTASCTATVTVRDLIAPTVDCKSVTIDLNPAGQATTTAAAINNGSTDNCSISYWSLSQSSFTCANLGANTVTLTATDQNGNSSSCTATVTVRDLIAPNVVCKPATIDLNAAGQATTTAAAVNNGSTDNCSISNWSLSQSLFTCANLGANTVTLTATDQNGNASTCTATVTVRDLIAPNVVCQPVTIDLNAAGQATTTAAEVNNGSTDNCSISNWNLPQSLFTCANLGANTVTLTATDQNGNASTCTATVTVRDLIAPNVVCQPVTIDLNAAGQATTTAAAVNNGSTDNCSISNWSLSQTEFTCDNLGENTVTLTATDQNGNASSCTATVTVRDLIAPNVVCKSVTIDLNAAGQATTTAAAVTNGSTDNCSISNWNLSQFLFTCANLGANTVTLTATDQNGNTASCTAMVTVRDLIAPTVACQSVTIDLNAAGQATTTAAAVNNGSTDNCSINNWNLSQTEFTCAKLGANTVTLTATDQNGNASSCTATVTVRDLIAPTVDCQSVTIDLNAAGQATTTAAAVNNSSTDNCSINNWNLSQSLFTCANLGANTVTLTATDQNGNASSCTATVTVRDLIAPNVVCQSVTIDLNAGGQATTTAAAVNNGSTDNCSISNWNLSQTEFTCANLGANTVTLTATDQNSNTASCTATVTVRDLIAPIVVCQSVTIDLNASGQATTTAAAVNNGSTDNCSISNLILSQALFTCANLGANTVTLTATDQNGNASSCTATVTVRDLIVPNALCKSVTIDLNAAGQAITTAAAVNNGSTDNCSISNWNLSQSLFTCANMGNNKVTLTVTDQNGNAASCTAVVTVKDPINPVAKCKIATVNIGANGTLTLNPSVINNGSTDNCSLVMSTIPSVFTCSNIGKNTVTLITTDGSGNSSTCTTQVTVKDATAPTALCKNATIYLNSTGQAVLTTAQVNNGSFDNCSISSASINKSDFNCSELSGSVSIVTLTVRDAANNASTCLAQVTVKDNIAPSAICVNTTVSLGADGKATVFGAELAGESFDNCSVWAFTPIAKVYNAANLGNNNLTVTVKDWSGNASTCTSVVTVIPYNGINVENDRDNTTDQPESTAVLAHLFPNPTTSSTNLALQVSTSQQVTIRVFDAAGRQVMHQLHPAVEGDNFFQLDFDTQHAGMYIIEILTKEARLQKRLSVVKD